MLGRRMVAVNWLWMMLGLMLAFFGSALSIQVAVPRNLANTTAHLATNGSTQHFTEDSALSASERNRRLIPYMAFYLPAHEIPINQQYAIQRAKGSPPKSPHGSAYLRLKSAGSAGSGPTADPYSVYQGVPQYPSGPSGEVYHALAYQQHHPAPQGPQQQQQQQQREQPILHLLPPGPSSGGAAPTGYTTTAGGIKIHKQKTVQHFPPTSPPPLQQVGHLPSSVAPPLSSQQQQQQVHRHSHHYRPVSNTPPSAPQQQHHHQQQQHHHHQQQSKQSKFNLTPFTSSNILPGHFVPIIYAPVSSDGASSNSGPGHINSYKDSSQTTAINGGGGSGGVVDDSVDAVESTREDPISHANAHKDYEQQQQQPIQVEYYESEDAAQSPSQSQQQQPQPPHSPTAIYHLPQQHHLHHHQHQHQHVANEASPSSASPEAHPPSPPSRLIEYQTHHQLQQQQHQQQQQQIAASLPNAKHATQFQTPKFENFFDDSPSHLHVVAADEGPAHIMTPQEKYVLYLQQRMRHNAKQRDHLKQRQAARPKPTQIFVVSSTRAPAPLGGEGEGEVSAGADNEANTYPQHSPIRHAVYARPDLPVPPNHQLPTAKPATVSSKHVDGQPQQQILHIPVRNIVDGLDAFLNQHRQPATQYGHQSPPSITSTSTHHSAHQKAKTSHIQYLKGGVSSPASHHHGKTKYVDYIIDEPKQSLDEDYHPSTGGGGYILVSTVAPPTASSGHPGQPLYISTARPLIRQQPTLRLHPVSVPQNSVKISSPSSPPPHQSYYTPKPMLPPLYAPHYHATPKPPTLAGVQASRRPYVVATSAVPQHTKKQHFISIPKEVTPNTERTPTRQQQGDGDAFMKQQQQQKQEEEVEQYDKPIELSKVTPLNNPKVHQTQQNHQAPPPNDLTYHQSQQTPHRSHQMSHQTHQTPQQQQQTPHQPHQTAQHPHQSSPHGHPAPQHPQQTHHHPHQQHHQPQQTHLPHQPPQHQHIPHHLNDPNQLPDIRSSSLAEILHKLQETNHLPQTLTPDNIDNSIKTLVTILENLKQTQKITTNPSQHHEKPSGHDYDEPNGQAVSEEDYNHNEDEAEYADQRPPLDNEAVHKAVAPLPLPPTNSLTPNKHPGPSTGRAGIDYPNYAEIPQTSFDCGEQRYKGFFGDPETNCQVWHYCDLNGGKASFLCPNGTIFSQIALTCDWWFNVKCSTTAQLYVLNERLYKYILPFTPKFPEDYSGPLVDKYLALKFQEMEEKMRLEKEKAAEAMKAAEEVHEMGEERDENLLEEAIQIQKTNEVAHPTKRITINSQVREQSSERNLLIDDEDDDVSQRASTSKLPETTMATAHTTRATAPPPLSVKPIVVSSTTGPDSSGEGDGRREQQVMQLSLRNAKQPTTIMTAYIAAEGEEDTAQDKVSVESKDDDSGDDDGSSGKISVQKVEVIEIKTDGNTGHLNMPQTEASEEQTENKLNGT